MPISHSLPRWSGTNFPRSTIRDAAGYVRNNLEVAADAVRLIYVNADYGSAHHDVATDCAWSVDDELDTGIRLRVSSSLLAVRSSVDPDQSYLILAVQPVGGI
jgi:hypothetical protein